jgi:hypothetical protein
MKNFTLLIAIAFAFVVLLIFSTIWVFLGWEDYLVCRGFGVGVACGTGRFLYKFLKKKYK